MADAGGTETGFAPINGAELYYEVAGTGPALVLLHAGVADHHLWDDQWPAFTARYRTIRYDARGYGRSAMPAGPFARHEDLHALLLHLSVERAYLAGVSIGGRTIIDFALAYPELTAALVPIAPGVSGQPPGDVPPALLAAYQEAYTNRDLERLLDMSESVWLAGPRRRPADLPPALRERFRATERRNLEQELAQPGPPDDRPLDPPAWDRLGEIRAPTLIIVGDQDVRPVLDGVDHLAATVPGARRVILPNVAHMVPMEAPAEVTRLVLDFLAAT